MARTPKILLTPVAAVAAAALATLAMPVRLWRTGDRGLDPLRFTSTATTLQSPRVWIDTDAACGHGARTDPDDCLAIALFARSTTVEIVGISTVFGNAPREVVDKTIHALTGVLAEITRSDVSALADTAAAGRWIAPRLRPWLSYWRQSSGREGFSLPPDRRSHPRATGHHSLRRCPALGRQGRARHVAGLAPGGRARGGSGRPGLAGAPDSPRPVLCRARARIQAFAACPTARTTAPSDCEDLSGSAGRRTPGRAFVATLSGLPVSS